MYERRPSDATTIEPRHVRLLDVSITPLSACDTVTHILTSLERKESLIIGNLNLHGVYMFHTNEDFAQYCGICDLILVDGAPIAWAARISPALRIGSTDWLDELMPRASGISILAIGGTPESSAAAQRHFRTTFPDVHWTGIDGYESQNQPAAVAKLVSQSNIVLVGMGMPLQEQWILHNRELLRGKVVANVGGCFDYYAGTQRLAPRWMGPAGIEWLYRLAVNPRRLAERYLVEPLKLANVLIRKKVSTAR